LLLTKTALFLKAFLIFIYISYLAHKATVLLTMRIDSHCRFRHILCLLLMADYFLKNCCNTVFANSDRHQHREKVSKRFQLFQCTLRDHYTALLAAQNDTNTTSSTTTSAHHFAKLAYAKYIYTPPFRGTRLDRVHALQTSFPPFSDSLRQSSLQTIRTMFTHAYDSYMIHAYPAPELHPLSCTPATFDLVRLPALTLIDALDTLLVMNNATEFARAVERLRSVQLVVDQNVSVFETTIRVVGGLASAHLLVTAMQPIVLQADVMDESGAVRWGYTGKERCPVATAAAGSSSSSSASKSNCPVGTSSDSSKDMNLETIFSSDYHDTNDVCILPKNQTAQPPSPPLLWKYDGSLLTMAVQLAERLLPAFNTRTGIPYGTVNLLYGVPAGETPIASLAGGGTLTLEFELLSRLSGDPRFGRAAKLASRALFLRKSPLHLYGKHIDAQTGQWTEPLSGIGSNSDSYFEYLAKQYFLFPQDDDFWITFMSAYAGVYNHSRLGEWYANVDMNVGSHRGQSQKLLESLMAFWPGMQSLLGEFAPAAHVLNSMMMVRELLGFLPERFNYETWKPDVGRGAAKHPLRPELLESCYSMHRATRGLTPTQTSGWQWAAEFALRKLAQNTRTECGYASVSSIAAHVTGLNEQRIPADLLTDEMPSFFLSETLKYLYLTFDDDNFLHQDEHRWIFTTEAHPIHYVEKPNEKRNSERLEKQVESLKLLLKERLHNTNIRKTDASLFHEKWAAETSLPAYMKEVLAVQDDALTQRKQTATSGGFFFNDTRILGPYTPDTFVAGDFEIDSKQQENLAHLAMMPLGSGTGTLLRVACPNIYASELLWINALNGGAVDYSDVYMSVISDDPNEHSNTFVVLGAAEAIGMLGSGHLLRQQEDTCPRSSDTNDEIPAKIPDNPLEVSQNTVEAGHVLQLRSPMGLFDVQPFPQGDGFYIQHVESGETIVATFLADATNSSNDFVMAYSATTVPEHRSKDEESKTAWRIMASRLAKLKGNRNEPKLDPATMEDRSVVFSDFEGHAFSCEVEVVEKYTDQNNGGKEGEEVLAKYPCAPALFGPTRLPLLIKSGGICIERMAYAPPKDDEVGCIRAASDPIGGALAEGTCAYDPSNSFCAQSNSIQITHRGGCSFYAKAVNLRNRFQADGVIVLNDDPTDLFVMSYGDDSELLLNPDDVPCSVLLTGHDGEDLLSKLQVDANESDTYIVTRISISSQQSTLENEVSFENTFWPVVRANRLLLHVYAKGGWGVEANKNTEGSDWQLKLLKHNKGSTS
jgi:mannosidase alpha-like ER degradation enhancer 2